MYDAIVIGKGPAGLSASLYTIRANLKTLVIGLNNSALKKASKIENYFGFSEAISGEFLLREGEKQALRLGVEIVEDEVISVEKVDFFEVTTSSRTFTGKSVLIATGQPQKKLKIQNLENFEGRGVSYCSTCDGFFYRDLKVGVLGYKDFAVHEAIELEAFTKDVTLFTNGHELDLTEKFRNEANNFRIDKRPVAKLEGDEFLKRICFEDGTCEDIDGIFVAYESASSLDFARKLGVVINDNAIVTDRMQQTNLEGLFAAGDCTGGFKQISVAVGQGALAGRGMIEYVRKLKTG